MTSDASHATMPAFAQPGGGKQGSSQISSASAAHPEPQWKLPYPMPLLPASRQAYAPGAKQYDYAYQRQQPTNPPPLSVDTYHLHHRQHQDQPMLPPPMGMTYAPPRSNGVYPFPNYRDPLASPNSDFSDDGSSSSEDRYNFNSPMTSPASGTSSLDHFHQKDPASILLQPAPSASGQGTEEKSLLDDFDPTPRAHIHYPSQLPPAHQAAEYGLHHSQPPSRNASYSSLEQLGYYYPSERHVGPSPAGSFISLPETEYDHTLRQGFTGFSFQDGRSGLSQSQAGWRSVQDLTSSQHSDDRASSLASSKGPSSGASRRGRRATIASGDEPLHWQSQTTTATKLAAIARRKPGVEAKFHCPYCNESFTRNYNLNGHVRAHRGERPFKCSTCPKAFARAHDLRRHSELHLNPSKHACGSCGKGFRRIEGLQKHYRQEAEAAQQDGLETHCIEPAEGEGDAQSPSSERTSGYYNFNFKMENPGQQHNPLFASTSSAASGTSSTME